MVDTLVGKNVKKLKEVTISNFSCPNCKQKTELSLEIIGGYVAIFFIPALPLKKDYILSCKTCNKRIKKNSLDYTENEKVTKEFQATIYKVPLVHYSGMSVLLGILGFAIFMGFEAKKKEALFIQNPKQNDVYYVKNSIGWTTYKVKKVLHDSVFVMQNRITLSTHVDVSEVDKAENYLPEVGYKLVEIKNMFDANQIYQVNR